MGSWHYRWQPWCCWWDLQGTRQPGDSLFLPRGRVGKAAPVAPAAPGPEETCPCVRYRSQSAGNASRDLINVIDKNPPLERSRMGSILRQKEAFLARLWWHKAAKSWALKQSCPKALGKHQGLAEKGKRNSCFLPLMYGCVCICSLIFTRSTGEPMPTETNPATMLARATSASAGVRDGSPWRSWLRSRCVLLKTPNTTEL